VILKSLRIARSENYLGSGKTETKLGGSIELIGESAKIELRITDEVCRKIIDLCADQLIETAHQTARLLKAEIIDGPKVLTDASEVVT
jgi:hypothetical protein